MQSFATLGHSGQVRRLKRLALAALADYPPAIVRLTPLVHEENTTFRAEDANGARYVLRLSRPGKNTLAEVESEMVWLAALRRDTNLMVPEPLLTRDGKLAQVVAVAGVPEPCICVLFRWVEGRFLNNSLTPRLIEQVGAFTARLHNHAAGFNPPAGFTRGQVDPLDPPWEAETLALLGAARPPEDVATLREAIHYIRAAVGPLGQGPDAYGLIHSDLHQWNYLFHQGEVRAIDFDDCGYGHYLFDLAATLYALKEHPDCAALRESLLAGYRSVRALPAAAEAALPALMMRRRINIIRWQIISREHPAFRDRWQEWVTYALSMLRAAMTTETML